MKSSGKISDCKDSVFKKGIMNIKRPLYSYFKFLVSLEYRLFYEKFILISDPTQKYKMLLSIESNCFKEMCINYNVFFEPKTLSIQVSYLSAAFEVGREKRKMASLSKISLNPGSVFRHNEKFDHKFDVKLYF